jgi:VWFA-related protein
LFDGSVTSGTGFVAVATGEVIVSSPSVLARAVGLATAMIAGLVVSGVAAAGQAAPAPDQVPQGEREAVFADGMEVSVVDLAVAVVGPGGVPVRGLTAGDFEVREDGEPCQISNFSEIAAGGSPAGAETGSGTETAHHVSLLFDNSSLQKRSRKRVLASLGPRVAELAASGAEVLVAITDGAGQLIVVQPSTSNVSELAAALDRVADMPTEGEAMKGVKRELKRTLNNARTTTSAMEDGGFYQPGSTAGESRSYSQRSPQSTEGAYASGQFSRSQATQLLDQVERVRRQEHARIVGSLVGMDRLVRGVSGLPGRNDVIWISEDLAAQPAVDVYQTFFDRFSDWQRELDLPRTDEWAARLDLRREFEYVAASAQAGGVAVHIVDAGDRDSDAASAGFDVSRVWSLENTTPLGPGATAGYDLSMALDQEVGAGYLASATGGVLMVGSRASDIHAELLAGLLSSYYSLGLRRSETTDGALHRLSVSVQREGTTVLYRHQARHSTAEQRLADLALSRFLIDEGPNPLELSIDVGAAQPADEGRVIREIGVTVPTAKLGLVARDDRLIGRLTIVLVCCDGTGNPTPPKLVRIDLSLPRSRLDASTIAKARVRVMMDEAAGRVAVAVRDDGSGTLGSALVAPTT